MGPHLGLALCLSLQMSLRNLRSALPACPGSSVTGRIFPSPSRVRVRPLFFLSRKTKCLGGFFSFYQALGNYLSYFCVCWIPLLKSQMPWRVRQGLQNRLTWGWCELETTRPPAKGAGLCACCSCPRNCGPSVAKSSCFPKGSWKSRFLFEFF